MKQNAIAQNLQSRLPPPIGDPAVNHYRRGANATVLLAGPTYGIAPPTGSARGRRVGRRNTRGPRRPASNRTAWLPVPATQPPVVAPVPVQSYAPISSTTSSIYSSGIPLSSGIYQQQPITSQGMISQQPLGLMQKQQEFQQQQNFVRPTLGSGAF